MIVRTLASHYRLITQNDHAHWAYQLLSIWPALAHNPRREAILEATRQHDRGWQGIDSSPLVQRSGKPHDFQSLPMAPREELWRRGIERREIARSVEPTQGIAPDAKTAPHDQAIASAAQLSIAWRELLICHHAWTIHRPYRTPLINRGSIAKAGPQKQSYLPLLTVLAAQRTLRIEEFSRQLTELDRCKEEEAAHAPWPSLTHVEDTLEQDYRWLSTLDLLSLMVCNAWPGPFQLPDPEPSQPAATTADPQPVPMPREITARFDGGTLHLDPFPLKGSYSLPLRSRNIPVRSYPTSSALSIALARSTWYTEEIRVLAS